MLPGHEATGPRAGKAAEEGAPSQKTCRPPPNRSPRGRRQRVSSTLSSAPPRAPRPRAHRLRRQRRGRARRRGGRAGRCRARHPRLRRRGPAREDGRPAGADGDAGARPRRRHRDRGRRQARHRDRGRRAGRRRAARLALLRQRHHGGQGRSRGQAAGRRRRVVGPPRLGAGMLHRARGRALRLSPVPAALVLAAAAAAALLAEGVAVVAALAAVLLALVVRAGPAQRRPYVLGALGPALGVFLLSPFLATVGFDVLWARPVVPVLGALDVTSEELEVAALNGLRLAAVALAFGAYALLLDHDRLVAAVGFARRSALAVALATRLVPTLQRDAAGLAGAVRGRGGAV